MRFKHPEAQRGLADEVEIAADWTEALPPEIAAHLAKHYSDETLTGREIEALSRSFPPKSTISRGGA
jgi:ABC-type nitrate/sulfonate/bicarbonate transport system substrate-binding protein